MLARLVRMAALAFLILPLLNARAQTPSLKEAYRQDFLIGSALGGKLPGSYTPREFALITSQFNAATPEWCMKPRPIQPREGEWHFEEADAFVRFCREHDIVPFGHTLVWHEDCPDWFFEDGEHPASRELVLRRLRNHIHTVVGRYKGQIRGWDVVNEAISDRPDEYLRKTKWLQTIGDDFVEQAFRFAHEADPDVTLQYNDYNIESEPKRSKAVRLIKSLQDKKIPIAAVGIQGHWSLDHVPYADLETAINAFHGMGLKVMISELDLDVLPRKPAGAADAQQKIRAEMARPAPCPPEVLRRQADQYARLFELFRKHRGQITRVSFWGIDDAHTWLNGWPFPRYNHPLLFDRESNLKPAFDAVIAVASRARQP
jgi:endo-1,4-beta-xylanase